MRKCAFCNNGSVNNRPWFEFYGKTVFGVFFLLTRSKSVSEKDDADDEAGWLVMLKSVRPDGYMLFLILAIYNYDTWPKSIHFVAKVGSNSK